ncbi:hypothetical protein PSTT_01221 [Puccinia striiformis]|uniref:Uncharacterized protein n=1 Tax=Puccinia striiformis TaxID=27350 RepID=A0A2S4W4K5_9BASI|nr:hypothetical protein PSTT_01221 [Puccinia striiformis]
MSDPSDYRQQGDLAVLGFTNMWTKDDTEDSTDLHQQVPQNIAPNMDCSLEAHMIQLKSTILPLLRQQAIKVTLLPGTADLPAEAAHKLKLIVEVQSEMRATLRQIQNMVQALGLFSLCREDRVTLPGPVDDQHSKEFKRFRLTRLDDLLQMGLLEDLGGLFSHTSRTIQIRGLSNHPTSYPHPIYLLDGLIKYILEDVDSIVRWLEKPEFDVVQDDWHAYIACLNNDLKILYMSPTMVNPGDQTHEDRLRATQLTQLALPVARLSIMFLNKLSKQDGLNKKPLQSFTEMRSEQLLALCLLSQNVSRSVQTIVFTSASGRTSNLPGELTKLEECLGSALVLIKDHFLPLIPDTDGFTNQTYFRTWFNNWSTTFNLAIRNLTNACQET